MERSPLGVAWDFLESPEPPRGHVAAPHLAAPRPSGARALECLHGSRVSFLLCQMGRRQYLPHGVMVRHHELAPNRCEDRPVLAPPFLHPEQDPPAWRQSCLQGAC